MADAKRTVRLMLETLPSVMHSIVSEMRVSDLAIPMPIAQYRTLKMLSLGHSSLSVLAKAQRVSLPTLSAAVTAMVDKGWIERETDPDDRRRQDLRVTEAGAAAMSEMEARCVEILAVSLDDLDSAELGTLEDAFAILRRVFGAYRFHGAGDEAVTE